MTLLGPTAWCCYAKINGSEPLVLNLKYGFMLTMNIQRLLTHRGQAGLALLPWRVCHGALGTGRAMDYFLSPTWYSQRCSPVPPPGGKPPWALPSSDGDSWSCLCCCRLPAAPRPGLAGATALPSPAQGAAAGGSRGSRSPRRSRGCVCSCG